MLRKLLLIAALIVLVNACGGKKDGDVKQAITGETKNAQEQTKDFLTEDIVKRVMELDASVKFQEDPSDEHYRKLTEYNERAAAATKAGKEFNEPYPEKPPMPTYLIRRVMKNSIEFSYPKPNAEEIRKKNEEASMQRAKEMMGLASKKNNSVGKMAGRGLMDAFTAPPESEVVLVGFGSYFPISKEMFEDATKRLRDGGNLTSQDVINQQIEKARKEGKDETTLKIMRDALEGGNKIKGDETLEDVSGVGDLATWSGKKRELRVFNKTHYFAITLDYKEAENKQKAIEIAQEVLKRM